MKKNLITAFLMTIATTILLGIIYPLVVTGLAQPVGHAVCDRLGPAVPGGEPLARSGSACCPGDDPPPLAALRVASRHHVAGRRVISSGQFCPQPVIDAEQGLHCQVRKVMDDVNGPAPGDPGNRQPGTVAVPGPAALTRAISITGRLIRAQRGCRNAHRS